MGKESKRVLVSMKVVDGYTPIHPALDFWDDSAIVSIGEQFQYEYDNDIYGKYGYMDAIYNPIFIILLFDRRILLISLESLLFILPIWVFV